MRAGGIRAPRRGLPILLLALAACPQGGTPPYTPPAGDGTVPLSSLPAGLTTAEVVAAVDGDTCVLRLEGREERVRLLGIDTPEKDRPYHAEATRHLASLLGRAGSKVLVEDDVERRDRYGRLLLHLYSLRGERALHVNLAMVRDGFAMVYTVPPNLRHQDRILESQREARGARRGLWGEASVQAAAATGPFVYSAKSRTFHAPGCEWAAKISGANRREAPTRDAALDQGLQPCRTCRP